MGMILSREGISMARSIKRSLPLTLALAACLSLCFNFLVRGRGVASPPFVRSGFLEAALVPPSQSPVRPEADIGLQTFNSLPLHFVENKGQLDAIVRFHSGFQGGHLYLAPREIVYQFFSPKINKAGEQTRRCSSDGKTGGEPAWVSENIRLVFMNAGPTVSLEGQGETGAKANYFSGNDSSQWVREARMFRRIVYRNIYPSIDLVVSGGRGRIKHEYRIQAGGDAGSIRLAYEGQDTLLINDRGQLEVRGQTGGLLEDTPFCYQTIGGQTVPVEAHYQILPNGAVTFAVGEHRRDRELVIDPEILYSSFLGGGSSDCGYGIAADGSGNVYVAGTTATSNFPVTGGSYDTSFNGNTDVFVAKFNYSGTSLLYSTFIGGGSADCGYGITVDGSGNAYITGRTESSNFPTTAGAYDGSANGGSDAFAVKLNAAGSALVYSTYLGGSNQDYGYAIALDSAGSVFIAGKTASANYPTTAGAYDTSHSGSNHDAFVTKLNATGTDLQYSTYLGGIQDDCGNGIALDGSGNAHVTGYTESSDFPTTPHAYDTSKSLYRDVFVTKFNAPGSSLLYSTFLGGSADDSGHAISVDGSGCACITGSTASSNFPATSGSYDTSHNGNTDAFAARLNASGSGLVYSTFLGGGFDDSAAGIAADGTGSACLIGFTASANFPTTSDAYDKSANGMTDVFITKLNATGTVLVYSTYLGGGSDDFGNAVSADESGNAFLTGNTKSSDFPVTPGAYDTTFNKVEDAFVVRLSEILPALPVSKHAIGDFDGDGVNEIAVDFGAAGISVWDSGSWSPLTSNNPESLIAGNFDGVLDDEIAADFGRLGLWIWNNSAWRIISPQNPDRIIAADTDGNGRLEVLGDFGTLGLWLWNGSSWSQLSGSNADFMSAADVDGNNDDELAVDFGPLGLWLRNGSSWSQYSSVDPDFLVAADTDGTGDDELVVDCGLLGLWIRNGAIWTSLFSSDSSLLAAADLDGNGSDEVWGSFGSQGVWRWTAGLWTKVSPVEASAMIRINSDGNADDELAVDFGTLGLWLRNGSIWTQLSAVNPESITAGNVDADAAEELLADFGSLGLWLWDNSSWTRISPLNAD